MAYWMGYHIGHDDVPGNPLTPEELKLNREVDNWMGGFMVVVTLLFIGVIALGFIFF
jgi:hypothetical protein